MQSFAMNNGLTIPALGYGVFQMSSAEVDEHLPEAIDAGYRHIDTANAYFNEVAVGRVGALLMSLGTPEAMETGMVLSNAVPCLIVGVLFIAGSAVWDEPVLAWIGGWFLAVTTAATLVGGALLWAIMALAGGGGMLIAAAVDLFRTRNAKRAAR